MSIAEPDLADPELDEDEPEVAHIGRREDVNRAYVTGQLHEVFEAMGLEVQGQYYMRPYDPNPPSGRAVNSDHLTAGALDIFFRTNRDRLHLDAVRRILDELVRRNIIRYYIDLGANAAHDDHIHASLQLGVY